jgi:type II secretory pathway pseudopilin PulG
MTIQFWYNDPTSLFNKNYIFELWPTLNMCYEQKLNAISRLIILLTILGYILTMSTKIIIVGILTLLVIFVLYYIQKKKLTKDMLEGFNVEGNQVTGLFDNNKEKSYLNPVTLESVLKTEFKEGNKKNPFSNVLLTQINDEPNRKAAPPAFNVDVDEDITKNIKKSVQMINHGIKNTNYQLFGDLWQNFQLDQSNRVFYSMPNTRVTNDQGAYSKYLYGFMPSGKESTPEGAFARVQDNYRYILY